MTRAIKPVATELVTDWIPCTTPPVRDGKYEFTILPGVGELPDGRRRRAKFEAGKWIGIEDDEMNGYELSGLMHSPQAYRWRGVRRWVLQGPVANMLSLIANDTVYIYLEDARPRSAKWNSLANARPFRTEVEAQRFADRHSRLKLTAVLP